VLKMAGAKKRDSMCGVDLLGELDPERAVFGAIYPGDASKAWTPEADVAYRWVRQGDWKLIVPQGDDPWNGYVKEKVLFNVADDPGEVSNRADEPDSGKMMTGLERMLDAWWNPVGF